MLSSALRFRILSVALGIAVVAPLLSGCSGAYVDRRREAGKGVLTYVGESTPDKPSICYNSMTTTPKEVAALAQKICAKSGRKAVPFENKSLDCTLLYPSRATYRCVGYGDGMWEGLLR